MSTKYLGKTFDIHGGGGDLKFPHHENEVAQSYGACDCAPARYWLHTNMLLLNGKKMSKSDGNTISPNELFTGDSVHVTKGYSPMVVRFFMLQTHYRSTLDVSDEALQAAEKGYLRLMEAIRLVQEMQHPGNGSATALDAELNQLMAEVHAEMSDDFNTPKSLARLFELVTKINSFKGGQLSLADITEASLEKLKATVNHFVFDVFGLLDESQQAGSGDGKTLDGLMQLVIEIRQEARARKDWGTSDKIRDALANLQLQLKDGKEGTTWGKVS